MRPIQTLAPGFLGMLGLKQGSLPADLVEAVSPTLDMFPFYALGTRETIRLGGVAPLALVAGIGLAFPEMQVPGNEVWYVHGFNVQVQTDATGTFTARAAHFNAQLLEVVRSGPAFSGTSNLLVWAETLNDFWMAPGDTLGLLCLAAVAGATMDGNVTFSRFIS